MEATPLVRRLIALAIEEDLSLGDITSSLAIPQERQSTAYVIARESLVVCGLDIAEVIVEQGGWSLSVARKIAEGVSAQAGDVLLELRGATWELLAAERTILNFLQRMCGVATHTREVCAASGGITILDTRKTMPGWRFLDKYSVRVGGAKNHRFSLGDMILVKNNHIDANPDGMRGALQRVVSSKPLYMPWEVEVRDINELRIALEFHPTIVMLDNFTDEAIKEAVKVVTATSNRPLIEVSGGVTTERLTVLAKLGVDAVSMGKLTTQAPNVDISMRVG